MSELEVARSLLLHFLLHDHLFNLLCANTLGFSSFILEHTEWPRNGDAVFALLSDLGRLHASFGVVFLPDLGGAEVLLLARAGPSVPLQVVFTVVLRLVLLVDRMVTVAVTLSCVELGHLILG